MAALLDAIDARIIERLQGGFPLSARPYRDAAAWIGIEEDELLGRLARLLGDGVLTRFGPMFQVERIGGAFLLAAIAVPESEFEAVAQLLGSLPEVAHNYRREHALNMWFVLASETPEALQAAVARIEALTGLPVLTFPKEREYFVGLQLHAPETADER
jgi:DNA-binding Lrp family transcriptional regulator